MPRKVVVVLRHSAILFLLAAFLAIISGCGSIVPRPQGNGQLWGVSNEQFYVNLLWERWLATRSAAEVLEIQRYHRNVGNSITRAYHGEIDRKAVQFARRDLRDIDRSIRDFEKRRDLSELQFGFRSGVPLPGAAAPSDQWIVNILLAEGWTFYG